MVRPDRALEAEVSAFKKQTTHTTKFADIDEYQKSQLRFDQPSLPAADVFPGRKAFHTPVENLLCNSSL